MNTKKIAHLTLYLFAYFLLSPASCNASLLRLPLRARQALGAHSAHGIRAALTARALTQYIAHSTQQPMRANGRQVYSLALAGKGAKIDTEKMYAQLQKKIGLQTFPKAGIHSEEDQFIRAMWEGNVDTIKHMLGRDKKFAEMQPAGFQSTLFYAMHIFKERVSRDTVAKYTSVVELLIHHGANVRLKNDRGFSVLQEAVRCNMQPNTLALLIRKGANPHELKIFPEFQTHRPKPAVKPTILIAAKTEPTPTALVPVDASKPKPPKNSSLTPFEPENPETFETFADLAGDLPHEIVSIVDYIKSPELRERHKKFGATLYKGILLYGPPGTGKTALARAVAKESKAPFFFFKAADIKNKWVGGTEQRIAHAFNCARNHAEVHPTKTAIIFLDELDSFLHSRDHTDKTWQDSEVNAFLTELDGFIPNDTCNLLVLGATNKKEKLDKAAIRPGRFDSHILVGLPSEAKQIAILNLLLAKRPFEHNQDKDKKEASIAQVLELFKNQSVRPSPADLKSIVDEASRQAARTKDLDVIPSALVLNAAQKHLGQRSSKRNMRDYIL